jgi:hypothetical protein
MGIANAALPQTIGGTDFKDFFSGAMIGISIIEMLTAYIC